MTATNPKRALWVTLSFLVSTGASSTLWGQAAEGNPTESAPMSMSELEALVAPIALYPDPLVAQVLAAATFPDQAAIADYWLQQHRNLAGTSLVQAVDAQPWDASVKALTQFPSVLDNMARNLTWTASLGDAYHNQKAEVMQAIQNLRAKAKAAGNLKSTPQMTVVQQDPQTIVIEPANPQVVYVPEYDPAAIYGVPYVTPGYAWDGAVAPGVLGFGAGVAIGALANNAWGWNSWGTDWHGGAVVYNHNNFYGNPAWHGGYYNGGYRDDIARANAADAYRGGGNFDRNVSGNTFSVNRDPGRVPMQEESPLSVVWMDTLTGSAVLADGRRGRGAIAAGEACARAVSAGSAVTASGVSMAVVFDAEVSG
jgi:Protein of unknown function (DUF3300)